MESIRILFVEDDPGDAELFQFMIDRVRSHRFSIEHVKRLQTALEQLEQSSFDAILLDLSLPDSFGLESIQRIYARFPEVPIVVLTGLEDDNLGLHAVHAGAQDYLVKSELNAGLLTRTLLHAIERQARFAKERAAQGAEASPVPAPEPGTPPGSLSSPYDPTTPVTLRNPPSSGRGRVVSVPDGDTGTLQRLGDFVIERKLGKGGMGVVFLATQLALKRKVALKVLSRSLTESKTFCKRFLAEARLAAGLAHPHVVQILTVGLDDDAHRLYFAMEYIEGENLNEYLERHQPSFGEILSIVEAVACALEHAWERGLVHRDIKPGNIMIGPRLHVKVLDFGLARSVEQELAHTGTGAMLGTPEYMAPEQASKQDRPDCRSDLYALGIVLYRMLAGAPPFEGDSVASLIFLHTYGSPRSICAQRPSVPERFDRILESLLAKKRDDRLAEPRQLVALLRELREQLKAEGRMDESPQGPAIKPLSFWEAQTGAERGPLLNTRSVSPTESAQHRALLAVRPARPGRGAQLWWALLGALLLAAVLGLWARNVPGRSGPPSLEDVVWTSPHPLWPPATVAELRGRDGSAWKLRDRSLLGQQTGRLSVSQPRVPWRLEGHFADFGAAAWGVSVELEGQPAWSLRLVRTVEQEFVCELLAADGTTQQQSALRMWEHTLRFAVSVSADSAVFELAGKRAAGVALEAGGQAVGLFVDAGQGGEVGFLDLQLRQAIP